jgi:hypothetical protein
MADPAEAAANDEQWEAATAEPPPNALDSLSLLKRKHKIRRGSGAAPMGANPFTTLKAALRFRLRSAKVVRRSVRVAQSPADGASTLDGACEIMNDVKAEDWAARQKAIEQLPTLLAPLDADGLARSLGSLAEPLVLQLCDLRSAILRSACEALKALADAHGAALAPLVVSVLPQLLANLCLLKVMASASAETATALLTAAPSVGAVKVLITHVTDSHKQVRRGALERLQVLVGHEGLTLPPKGLAAVLGALGASAEPGRGITDADAPTRAAAASAYWAAARRYPGKQAESWYAKLEDKERKLVDKHRPAAAA